MYIKIGTDFADPNLHLLLGLLKTLDQKIVEITELILDSPDPESDGLTDNGEYFIGAGFVLIQQYLTDTLTLTGISKRTAFELGPRYSKEHSVVMIINAAANWWKHESEWIGNHPNKQSQLTREVIMSITEYALDYPLSNVLSKLLQTSNITLSALKPKLIHWRKAIDENRA